MNYGVKIRAPTQLLRTLFPSHFLIIEIDPNPSSEKFKTLKTFVSNQHSYLWIMQAPIPEIPSQLFGLIIPGREVITSFLPVDPSGTKFTLTIPFPINHQLNNNNGNMVDSSTFVSGSQNDINEISSVSNIVFFLLPNITLPPNSGAMLYWSATASHQTTPSSSFELLGALTPTQPSTILTTGWSTHEPLQKLISEISQTSSPVINITFGISIESLDSVNNVHPKNLEKNANEHKTVAHKIALDLFNYLQSFDDTQRSGNGWMNVPTNVFDRWFKRFEMKLGRDPNFFMKCSKE